MLSNLLKEYKVCTSCLIRTILSVDFHYKMKNFAKNHNLINCNSCHFKLLFLGDITQVSIIIVSGPETEGNTEKWCLLKKLVFKFSLVLLSCCTRVVIQVYRYSGLGLVVHQISGSDYLDYTFGLHIWITNIGCFVLSLLEQHARWGTSLWITSICIRDHR